MANAAVSRIELVRAGETLNVTIHTARPGIVIGKKGEDIEKLRHQILVMNNNVPVQIAVEEIRKPELDALLVAEKRLPATRKTDHVSPGYEAGGAEHHALGRQRRQSDGGRAFERR